MSSIWTVEPATERIELAYHDHAFWIDVKKELTVGEEKKASASAFRSMRTKVGEVRGGKGKNQSADEDVINWDVDLETAGFGKTYVWLAGWSLTHENGSPIPLSLNSVKSLRPEVYDIIEKAVDVHAETVKGARGNESSGNEKS